MDDLSQILNDTTTLLAYLPSDNDRRNELADKLKRIRTEANVYQTDEAYVSHVESGLQQAHAIRTGEQAVPDDAVTSLSDLERGDGVEAVNWRQIPLCGCHSPTCRAKQGDLPTACRDRSNNLLDPRSPIRRVKDYIEVHRQPHAINVIQRSYINSYQNLYAEAKQIFQDSKALRETHSRDRRQEAAAGGRY